MNGDIEELFYTRDEKYLCASDEIYSGNYAKAKIMLQQILAEEPGFGKAHYQLGRIHFYELKDFDKALYHYKVCLQTDAKFPDAYLSCLNLLFTISDDKSFLQLFDMALKVKGMCMGCLYNYLGFFHEKNRDWKKAIIAFKEALLHEQITININKINESLDRVEKKKK